MKQIKFGRGYIKYHPKRDGFEYLKLMREETIQKWELMGFFDGLSEPKYFIGVDPAISSQDITVFKRCDSLTEIILSNTI